MENASPTLENQVESSGRLNRERRNGGNVAAAAPDLELKVTDSRRLIRNLEVRGHACSFAPVACLLVAARIEIGPPNVAPQYSGHPLAVSPSSANRCSSTGSSLAASSARRVRARRANFSASAVSTA